MSNEKKKLAVEVGQRIGFLRQKVGMTQEQLAEKIETNAKYITVLESGNKVMRIDTFVNICNALKADYSYLLTGNELLQQSKQLQQRLEKLSTDEYAALIAFLDAITKDR